MSWTSENNVSKKADITVYMAARIFSNTGAKAGYSQEYLPINDVLH